jgi:hypothetical protein
LNIIILFKKTQNSIPPRQVVEEEVDRSTTWACFHGVAQGDSHIEGACGVLYLKETHVLKFKVGLGR